MDWFRHDVNAHDDIKIKMLVRLHGAAGYGAYWHLVELVYSNDGKIFAEDVESELFLLGITEDKERENLMDSLKSLGLFYADESGMWRSYRIDSEIAEAAELRRQKIEAGRKGGLATQTQRQQRSSNAKAPLKHTSSNAKADSSTLKHNTLQDNTDDNLGSPLQEDNQLLDMKYKNNKTEIVSSELLLESPPSPPSAVISLTLIGGKQYPVTQEMVDKYAETFPAVDIMQELRKMNLWCDDPKNVSRRKTERGIQTFIRNWLSSEQDKARRVPQHNTEVIRGTNIQMSLVADGTRPDQEYPEVKFE